MATSNANANNKISHLKQRHGVTEAHRVPRPAIFAQQKQGGPSVRREAEEYKCVATTLKKPVIHTSLISWLVICQIAFAVIEHPVFRDFLKSICPTVDLFIPLVAVTVRAWIISAFQTHKQMIIERLGRSHGKVHFSFDLWTSPNHLALLAVIGHFIDDEGRPQDVGPPPRSIFQG